MLKFPERVWIPTADGRWFSREPTEDDKARRAFMCATYAEAKARGENGFTAISRSLPRELFGEWMLRDLRDVDLFAEYGLG